VMTLVGLKWSLVDVVVPVEFYNSRIKPETTVVAVKISGCGCWDAGDCTVGISLKAVGAKARTRFSFGFCMKAAISVEILIARSLILLSKRATRPYIYGTSTYVLI
jgi:hypothetical protein